MPDPGSHNQILIFPSIFHWKTVNKKIFSQFVDVINLSFWCEFSEAERSRNQKPKTKWHTLFCYGILSLQKPFDFKYPQFRWGAQL